MDAFDADVLIYAAVPGNPLGARVRRLFAGRPTWPVGIGSVLLLPQLLGKPMRDGAGEELAELASLLAQVDLRHVDREIAELAVALGAAHQLRAADAVHLAAVTAGADRFITTNRRDFGGSITEIDVTFPDDLAAS